MVLNLDNQEYCDIEYKPRSCVFTTYKQGIMTNKRVVPGDIFDSTIEESYNEGKLETRTTSNNTKKT